MQLVTIPNGLVFATFNIVTGTLVRQVLPWGQTREKELGDFDYYDDGFRYEISSMDGNDMLIAFDAEGGGMTSYVTRLTEEGIEPLRPLRVKDNWPDFSMNYQAFYLADGNILYGKQGNKIRDPDAVYGPLAICDRAGNELYVFEDFQYRLASFIGIHLSPNKRFIVISGYSEMAGESSHLIEIVYDE